MLALGYQAALSHSVVVDFLLFYTVQLPNQSSWTVLHGRPVNDPVYQKNTSTLCKANNASSSKYQHQRPQMFQIYLHFNHGTNTDQHGNVGLFLRTS